MGGGRRDWRHLDQSEKTATIAVELPMSRKKPSSYEPPQDPEVLEWWSMTPAQRWAESQKLWATFLALGGSLEPEPDRQSPFYDPEAAGPVPAHGRPGLHSVRRRRVQPRSGSRHSRRRK